MKIDLSNVRQTYIFMWHQNGTKNPNGVKYIFNRSISWGKINFRRLQPVIDLLGEDSIRQMINIVSKLDDDVDDLTSKWVFDNDIFSILEIHPEWKNINCENQSMINIRKKEIVKSYDNAFISKDNIIDESIRNKIENDILINTKKKIQQYLIDLNNRINDYFKQIYEPYIVQYDNFKNTLAKQQTQILENSKKLARQNYMINVLDKKIVGLLDKQIIEEMLIILNKNK